MKTALLTLTLFLSCQLSAQIFNTRDSLALVDFYDSTNGDNWENVSNWKTSAPLSWWGGVGVTGDRVTAITLMGKSLTGHIPASFGNLDSLKYLYLIDNRITGNLPESMGNMSVLQILNVGANYLTGRIPSFLSKLSNLEFLDLYANRFTGEIPGSLTNRNKLRWLDVSYNNLGGNIDTLCTQREFQLIIVSNNFTFQGIEPMLKVSSAHSNFELLYTDQKNIPVSQQNERLSVSVGGTPANNTYKWYKTGTGLVASVVGDSTYTPVASGDYYVEVTNALASLLTLKSDVVTAKNVLVPLCPDKASVTINAGLAGSNYQWQVSLDSSNFINLGDDSLYTGITTATLSLVNIPSSFSGRKYRCLVNGDSSAVYTVRFINNWIGNGNSDWNNPANWSCGKLPDENTTVIVKSGSVVLNQNSSIASLVLSPGASFTVNPGYTLTILQY